MTKQDLISRRHNYVYCRFVNTMIHSTHAVSQWKS